MSITFNTIGFQSYDAYIDATLPSKAQPQNKPEDVSVQQDIKAPVYEPPKTGYQRPSRLDECKTKR